MTRVKYEPGYPNRIEFYDECGKIILEWMEKKISGDEAMEHVISWHALRLCANELTCARAGEMVECECREEDENA